VEQEAFVHTLTSETPRHLLFLVPVRTLQRWVHRVLNTPDPTLKPLTRGSHS
jgi:hypothetical protein